MTSISTIALAASRTAVAVGSAATAGPVKVGRGEVPKSELFWTRLMYQLQQPQSQSAAVAAQPRPASGPAITGDGSGTLDAITAQLDFARRLQVPAPNSTGY